jgi:hypothetical protein
VRGFRSFFVKHSENVQLRERRRQGNWSRDRRESFSKQTQWQVRLGPRGVIRRAITDARLQGLQQLRTVHLTQILTNYIFPYST